ncbi:GNAT family N-acetyltransferase [Ciceribacter sp. L1K23]|uniref:GNAT family N-acetyltransferase n=1 Tax=Ciceribacter sp. L1K23 TaxID=2820276 RepID=UPI001B842F5B|nr:GNAT family N-acetyltransferase [Ciceribacter sp. L1K23]MBR0556053.1 GNAT family N-acetyltransferase [Ciceribacter sp. L1K23]
MRPISVDLHTRVEPLEAAWRLLERDRLNSLHQGYDWCASWAKTHTNPLAVLHGMEEGRSIFILPLEIVRNNMIRTAQFIGSRFNNINTGLFDSGFRARCDKAVAEQVTADIVKQLHGKADLVSLQNIPLDWRGERHPFSTLPVIEHQNHAFQLPLFEDFEATINQLNGKRRRKNFRNQQRKLEAAGGYRHVVARSDSDKTRLLDLFFFQKAVRFKAMGIPNVFQPPETQAFFRMLLATGRDGRDTPLELHALEICGPLEGKIAAIAGLSRKGDHVICQFGSIDETLVADTSPGEFLFWLMIEKSCAEGAALFDFGVGDQDYKRRWCTVETIQHDVLLPVSAPGRLAAIAQRGVTRTKAVIKGNPQLYAIIQRLRSYADETPTAATGTGD